MEHKTLAFEVKAIDYEGRTLEGYAAAFGNIDQVGDIIHPGAFRKTLQERGQRIKVLWQHDPTEPIGRLMEAREDERGLYVKAVISDTTRGRDALALLRDGAIGEMSIGYDSVKGATDYSKMEGKTVRNLREIKLYEFSLVTFPANEQAVVTALKQQDVMPSEGKPYVIAKRGDKWGVYKEDADGNATGDALGMHDSEESAKEQLRALYASEADGKKSIKAGRTISRATLAKLQAARDVIDELCSMGEGYDEEAEDETEDETEDMQEMKSAPGDVPQAADIQHEEQAGPVKPPTDAKRLLLEIEILESQLHTLEV